MNKVLIAAIHKKIYIKHDFCRWKSHKNGKQEWGNCFKFYISNLKIPVTYLLITQECKRNQRLHWGKKKKSFKGITRKRRNMQFFQLLDLYVVCLSCPQDYIHYEGRDLVCLSHFSSQASSPVLFCARNSWYLITEACNLGWRAK